MRMRFVSSTTIATKRTPRSALATIRIRRRSSRSTKTPAMALKTTAGTRNVSSRRLTAEADAVRSATSTVSP